MNLDPNTPPWVQHLALEVEDAEALEQSVKRLKDYGVEVIGPVDHHIFQSIYFHDPDGHRVERSEEHTSELQSLMRISYAVFCLKNKKQNTRHQKCQRVTTATHEAMMQHSHRENDLQ